MIPKNYKIDRHITNFHFSDPCFNFDMFLNRLSETVIFETGLSTNGPLTTEPLAIELV